MKPISLSKRSNLTTESPINWLIQYDISHPDVISLAAGLVDYPSLPQEPLISSMSSILKEDVKAQKVLQYGSTQGNPQLREAITAHVSEQESKKSQFEADDCIVTNGSQQLLYLIADTLLNPGDIVLLEAPTYFVFMDTLRIFGVECINIAMDSDGLKPDALRDTLESLKDKGDIPRVKFLYTVDYFQNPTGISLSEERKPEILEIIKEYSNENQILILEDAAYRDLSFTPDKTHSIKHYDSENEWVMYTSTFSKPYCPGLKLGYGILPPLIMDYVIRHKGNHDFGTPHLNQHLALDALKNRTYHKQYMKLQNVYAEKAKVMIAAMEKHFPKEVTYHIPQGGFYIWVTLPDGISTDRKSTLFSNCLKYKVLYVPGEYCYYQGEHSDHSLGHNQIRLSYGTPNIEEIEEGIKRLAQAMK
ncbi:MAG: PLP-dependent aminotransferase family protein [Fibrobacterales bacterium]